MTKTPKAAKAATPAAPSASAGDYGEIRHAAIAPDPLNPRKHFDDDGLAELAASIAVDGLLEPLVVRALEPDADGFGRYMLIAGERRWRAIGQAIFAGAWPAERPIPAMIRDVGEADARRLALVENLQRRDLNPIEEARAIEALQQLTGASAGQIGRELGFTERWAQQRLSLLKLPEKLQDRVDRAEIKVEDARQAAAIWDKLPAIKQTELARGAITVQAAKAWHDAQPQPLSDAAKLAIMELLEKAEAAPYVLRYSSQKAAKIAGETVRTDNGPNGVRVTVKVDDPKGALAELRKRYLLDDPAPVRVEDVETGEHYVALSYSVEYYLRDIFRSALEAKFRQGAIPTLRVQVYGLQADHAAKESGGYATPWLNVAPVEIPAAVQAQIDAKREARAAREAEDAASREAELQAQAATRAARAERIERIKAADTAGELLGKPAAAVALALEAGRPLPWFLDEQSQIIIAANGEAVTGRPWSSSVETLGDLRLAVALANAAGGLVTPARRPSVQDPDAPTRDAFVAMIAGELLEAEDEAGEKAHTVASAQAAAEAGLAAFLLDQAVDYGDADYDWTEFGANAIATGILDEGLGAQVDLEQAIAAAEAPAATPAAQEGDDDTAELSPQLLALAGVKRTPARA